MFLLKAVGRMILSSVQRHLQKETHHKINAETFEQMKNDAILLISVEGKL